MPKSTKKIILNFTLNKESTDQGSLNVGAENYSNTFHVSVFKTFVGLNFYVCFCYLYVKCNETSHEQRNN